MKELNKPGINSPVFAEHFFETNYSRKFFSSPEHNVLKGSF